MLLPHSLTRNNVQPAIFEFVEKNTVPKVSQETRKENLVGYIGIPRLMDVLIAFRDILSRTKTFDRNRKARRSEGSRNDASSWSHLPTRNRLRSLNIEDPIESPPPLHDLASTDMGHFQPVADLDVFHF